MPLRLIARKFLPHTPKPEALAALASTLVGVALLVIKFTAYFVTGSAAIFSDAMESIVNVLASAFAVYALYYAHRPADREHPYGHGKIEFMSAGFEGGMILVATLVGILNSHLAPDGKPPQICSYHKLRHRHSGRYHWVDFHIMVPAGMTIEQGHAIASAIEYEIELALGEGNATAHVEPSVEAG